MFADRAKIYYKNQEKAETDMCPSAVKNMCRTAVRTVATEETAEMSSLLVDEGMNTLDQITGTAENSRRRPGEEGGKKNCHGKNGADLILKVPEGTIIKRCRQPAK